MFIIEIRSEKRGKVNYYSLIYPINTLCTKSKTMRRIYTLFFSKIDGIHSLNSFWINGYREGG